MKTNELSNDDVLDALQKRVEALDEMADKVRRKRQTDEKNLLLAGIQRERAALRVALAATRREKLWWDGAAVRTSR